MKNVNIVYRTKEVAEKLGVAPTTVRKYAQTLEKYGYEFLKDGDKRSFVDTDLFAFHELDAAGHGKLEVTAKRVAIEQKERLENAKNDILEHGENEIKNPDARDMMHKINAIPEIQQNLSVLMQMMASQQERMQIKSPEQERAERLDAQLSIYRIENKLKSEALQLWSEKPRKERGGNWFFPEDTALRDKFVLDFIEEHIQEHIESEMNYKSDLSGFKRKGDTI